LRPEKWMSCWRCEGLHWEKDTRLKTDGLYVFITGNVVRRKYVEPYGTNCTVLLSPGV